MDRFEIREWGQLSERQRLDSLKLAKGLKDKQLRRGLKHVDEGVGYALLDGGRPRSLVLGYTARNMERDRNELFIDLIVSPSAPTNRAFHEVSRGFTPMQALLAQMAVYAVKHQAFHIGNDPQKDSGKRMLERLREGGYVSEDGEIVASRIPSIDLSGLHRRKRVDDMQKSKEGPVIDARAIRRN